jgi:hypothetical protein
MELNKTPKERIKTIVNKPQVDGHKSRVKIIYILEKLVVLEPCTSNKPEANQQSHELGQYLFEFFPYHRIGVSPATQVTNSPATARNGDGKNRHWFPMRSIKNSFGMFFFCHAA